MILEFKRAHGVRNPLDRIRLPMRKIVHGVDAPFVSGAVVIGVKDAVHHGIAQVEVRRSHVDFRAQSSRAIGKFAGAHALEEIEIFFDRTVAIRTVFAGLSQRAAILADFVRA